MSKRRGKLQTKLIIYFSCIAIIPALIIMSISINFTNTSTEELVGMYTKKLVAQLNCNMDNLITTGRGIAGELVNSIYIQRMAMYNNRLSGNEQSALRAEVKELISTTIKMQDAIEGVYIYGQGNIYYKDLKGQDYFDKDIFLKSEGYTRLIESNASEFVWFTMKNEEQRKVYLARKVSNSDDGAVILAMDTTYLDELLTQSNIEGQMSLAILSENNEVITQSAPIDHIEMWTTQNSSLNETENSSYTNIINGNIVSFSTCSNGWKVVSIASIDTLMADFKASCIKSVMMLFICSLLAIALSILLGRKLINPLLCIAQEMEKVKAGDLKSDHRLKQKLKGQTQEIEMLVVGFASMVKSLRQVREASDMVTAQVKTNTKDLSHEANKTNELGRAVNVTIEQVALGAKSQSEETQRATVLMEVLSERVNEVGKVVSGIDATSKEVMAISHNTEQKLNDLSRQSEENIVVTERVSTSVSDLKEATYNMNSVLSMVKYINNQTEMLALNASIEAARAGNMGKGFAVIASEVRELALETNDAITAIEQLLNVIEHKSQLAVKELKEAMAYFKMQKPVVDDATKSFVVIMERMHQIDTDIHEAHELVGNIVSHKTGALDKIVKINGIAQEFACVTEEASNKTIEQAKCIDNIHRLTVQLDEVVKELETCH